LVSELDDPVLVRRARIASAVTISKRVGYAALLLAMAAFAVGAVTDFPSWLVVTSIAGLIAATVILPIPIVFGYGVRAAEREERQSGR
jgi:hypothetical protein